MPAKRRRLNFAIIRSNLSEAVEELQRLDRKGAKEELTEAEFQVGLRHAYHHLKFAWVSDDGTPKNSSRNGAGIPRRLSAAFISFPASGSPPRLQFRDLELHVFNLNRFR
jgi:hypothetical protein